MFEETAVLAAVTILGILQQGERAAGPFLSAGDLGPEEVLCASTRHLWTSGVREGLQSSSQLLGVFPHLRGRLVAVGTLLQSRSGVCLRPPLPLRPPVLLPRLLSVATATAAAVVLQRPAALDPARNLLPRRSPRLPPLVSEAGCSGAFLWPPDFAEGFRGTSICGTRSKIGSIFIC
ncbi:uncharacterized protein ltc4s isoform X2 [Takifugu flavidus]|uniref:uncharacterized protein ltc4s isoform X2 n=1 Tax=Takifugu flavidus TaxID=433684 RepID=UPI0025442B8A|nr:uncharacterized protein ltc4s isoform X2 [Takifugu flavidus]